MLTQIISEAQAYLMGHCSLDDLEDWLLVHLQEILDSGDQKAIQLADNIDAALIQLNEGIIDEATFYDQIQSYARLAETTFSQTNDEASVVQAVSAASTKWAHLVIRSAAPAVEDYQTFARW